MAAVINETAAALERFVRKHTPTGYFAAAHRANPNDERITDACHLLFGYLYVVHESVVKANGKHIPERLAASFIRAASVEEIAIGFSQNT